MDRALSLSVENMASGENVQEPIRRKPNRLNVNRLALLAAALGLPPGLFFLFRPDWYYILNGIDSYFYTGYAQNFASVMKVSADQHYFVTRWPLYLPNHLSVLLFGAKPGFLVLRWLTASLVFLVVLMLGRRRWRQTDSVCLGLLVLLSPIFLRTLLSDYVDSVTVPLAMVALVVVAIRPRRVASAVVLGIAGALIASSNAIGFAMVLCIVPMWLLAVPDWKSRFRLLVYAGVSFLVVICAATIFFRVQFGIANVYRPTLAFLRHYSNYQDPVKSHRLWWLGYRLWIYLPALVVGAARFIHVKKIAVFDESERIVLGTCGVEWCFQVWYQFSRHGSTLEISYYWSMMAPALVLATVVLVGKLASLGKRSLLPTVTFGLVVFLLLFRSDMPSIYGSWLDAAVVVGGIYFVWSRRKASAAVMLTSSVFVFFSFQTGSPRPEPLLKGDGRIDASYESVFNESKSAGIDLYRASTWFTKEFNGLGRATVDDAFFWTGHGSADAMAAMYSAHVDGRWLNATFGSTTETWKLSPRVRALMTANRVRIIVMLGSVADLAGMTESLNGFGSKYETILSGTAPDTFATRMRVVRITEAVATGV